MGTKEETGNAGVTWITTTAFSSDRIRESKIQTALKAQLLQSIHFRAGEESPEWKRFT